MGFISWQVLSSSKFTAQHALPNQARNGTVSRKTRNQETKWVEGKVPVAGLQQNYHNITSSKCRKASVIHVYWFLKVTYYIINKWSYTLSLNLFEPSLTDPQVRFLGLEAAYHRAFAQ